jgi:hypothetical protein
MMQTMKEREVGEFLCENQTGWLGDAQEKVTNGQQQQWW